MNESILKERERLYKQRKELKSMNFNIKDKRLSVAHYRTLAGVTKKYVFYDNIIKLLNKSENS